MLRRLSTIRVRSPTCTTFIPRSSPSLISCVVRPSPFAVFGKSNAIRAGCVTVKLAGGAASGCLVVIRTITRPPWVATLNASIEFCWAESGAREEPRAKRDDEGQVFVWSHHFLASLASAS